MMKDAEGHRLIVEVDGVFLDRRIECDDEATCTGPFITCYACLGRQEHEYEEGEARCPECGGNGMEAGRHQCYLAHHALLGDDVVDYMPEEPGSYAIRYECNGYGDCFTLAIEVVVAQDEVAVAEFLSEFSPATQEWLRTTPVEALSDPAFHNLVYAEDGRTVLSEQGLAEIVGRWRALRAATAAGGDYDERAAR